MWIYIGRLSVEVDVGGWGSGDVFVGGVRFI